MGSSQSKPVYTAAICGMDQDTRVIFEATRLEVRQDDEAQRRASEWAARKMPYITWTQPWLEITRDGVGIFSQAYGGGHPTSQHHATAV